jgi:acetyltransferase-like isoleucine patch superfamily enzyme
MSVFGLYTGERTGLAGNSPMSIGRFTYGIELLTVLEWGEGAALRIGSFCSIAPATIFLGGDHRVDWITTFPFGHIFEEEFGSNKIEGYPLTKGDVIIGNDVWIGRGATIFSGLAIGSGAVIAANATVVKDVAPYDIVAGNPAKTIKARFDAEIIELLLELGWWDLPVSSINEISRKLCAEPSVEILRDLVRHYKTA